MGSRGPLQKREGRVRGDRPGTADAPQARLLPVEALDPSPRWLKVTGSAYVEYLTSPVANVVDPIDMPAIFRLFAYYDLWTRLFHKWFGELEQGGDFELLGEGTSGQAVVHPILASMRALEGSIKELETRFGITPQSRARLGIDLGEAAAAADKAKRLERQDREEKL